MSESPLIESAGEGIIGLDCRGLFTFLNPAAAHLLGYRPEECIGTHHHSLVHHRFPDGTEYLPDHCPLMRVLNDGSPCSVDDEVFWRRDGTSFAIEYSAHPVRNDEGYVVGAVVIFRDITARKNAEGNLVQLLQRYETLLSSLDAIVWESDSTTFAVTYASSGFERLLGYPKEQWLSHQLSWQDLIHPDDLGKTLRMRMQVVTARRSQVLEYRLRAADGRILWVCDYVSAVQDGRHGTKITGVIVKVTEQKRLRPAFKARE